MSRLKAVLPLLLMGAALCVPVIALAAGPQILQSQPASAALAVLPPEPAVRQVLEALPQLRASVLNIDVARSGQARLESGHYEWNMRVGTSRRSDQSGGRFNEQELAFERPIRWFGKAGQDRTIGEKGVLLAQAGHADAWHEASRGLMKDWFDAVREIALSRQLTQQAELALQLRIVADKRVRAGDAPRLELLQADTETKRVSALQQQAQLRQEQALQVLAVNYPGLPLPPPSVHVPVPAALPETPAFWLQKITSDNHELELAQAEAELYALQASRVAAERMPDPTIGMHAGRERSGQERLIGISISIPLPGSARSAERSIAQSKADMAGERVTQMQMKVSAGARRVITESQRSYDIWQTMQQISAQSAQQAGTMMGAYQLGEASLAEALATRRHALDAALAAEAAQIAALEAFARLQLDAHLLWAID